MKTTLLTSVLLSLSGAMSFAPSVGAADPELRHARICDASACYFAWMVVDSDRDGVSDADEVVAGTDPYDPKSRPGLALVVGMIGERLLPTFEFGLGKIIVNPAEMQAQIEAFRPDNPVAAAFPLDGRADALTRMGLSTELLKEHGLDPGKDGLTLVQEFRTDNSEPYRRVGGVDARQISAGGDDDVEPQINDVVDFINHEDGSTTYILDNGDTLYDGADGQGVRQDKNGTILDDWYVNPDADTGTGEPTKDQIKAWERVRNATVRTAAGREPPTVDPKGLRNPRETIVLIDPEYADYTSNIQDPARHNIAQPETHPGLPNPQVSAGCKPFCQ